MAEESLTDKQEELVDKLIKAGLQKNIALTLVFVASRDETKSRDIEDATNLRQPEVSIAMQELRGKGWVTKRDIKKEGKGRPVHGYHLANPIEEIIEEIEEKEKERIADIENNLEEIKDLADSCF
ncbi:MAG: ArsR family transcriptional regulator [Candidatus Thermoplasmatota archaeon]|nr:ArsR family transcriptional regulator [Candidatus Thermoplasmatota archaeon]